MKHLFILAVALMAGMSLQAQQYVNLSFTAIMQGGSFQALDSVKITNVTRGWEQTLYYPDTILQLTNVVGITTVKAKENSLIQNIPNPFNGSTEVVVNLSSQENVRLSLVDISGKQCATYTGSLSAGTHRFTVSAATAQNYVLTLKTSEGEQCIKLLARQGMQNYGITYINSGAYAITKQVQKAVSDKEFQIGDNMSFVGYATFDNAKKFSQLSVTQAGSDATYTFQFVKGYAIGDVYFNELGNAEGIVCWIADTVFSESGKYYGKSGKIISMYESDKTLMFATINRSTNSYDSVDGRTNTAKQMALRSDTSTYLYKDRIEAAKWCTDKGEGWYFPAKCEMIQVFNNINTINNILQQNGGEIISTQSDVYWTSTEKEGGKYAFTVFLLNNNLRIAYSEFYSAFYVRAMKWFLN